MLATDSLTGSSRGEPVVDLIRSVDTELTELSVRQPTGQRAVLRTTPKHPFFVPATHSWTGAGELAPGTVLHIQFGLCLRTGPGGEYEVNGLPTGEYTVLFDGENSANYLRRFYDDAETFAGATPVPVTAGLTVSGIDAALHPGAQMFGRVTEAGTGAPAAGIEVCLFDYLHAPSTEYLDRCAETDAVGNYAMRSLREGTFKVTFLQRPWSGIFDKLFLQQWWNGIQQ